MVTTGLCVGLRVADEPPPKCYPCSSCAVSSRSFPPHARLKRKIVLGIGAKMSLLIGLIGSKTERLLYAINGDE